jgi:hypothetical protein
LLIVVHPTAPNQTPTGIRQSPATGKIHLCTLPGWSRGTKTLWSGKHSRTTSTTSLNNAALKKILTIKQARSEKLMFQKKMHKKLSQTMSS